MLRLCLHKCLDAHSAKPNSQHGGVTLADWQSKPSEFQCIHNNKYHPIVNNILSGYVYERHIIFTIMNSQWHHHCKISNFLSVFPADVEVWNCIPWSCATFHQRFSFAFSKDWPHVVCRLLVLFGISYQILLPNPRRPRQAHTCSWLNPPGVQSPDLQHQGYRAWLQLGSSRKRKLFIILCAFH